VISRIQTFLEIDTAGDPITGLKWTRKTTRKISKELGKAGIAVSHTTVARLLRNLKYRLRVNHKKIAGSRNPQRNEQFEYIAFLRYLWQNSAIPVISVDTKKRELVGPFKNPGAVWSRTARAVLDHDFRSDSVGVAIPYGIYDLALNQGAIFVGDSHDTADFAVDAIGSWWRTEGRFSYPGATQLLVLADNGGSNGSSRRAWRYQLQSKLADRFGLTVTVCHYPPGTSKWNPIEHRLFAEVSKNMAGEPLISYETILNFIRTTSTETGLTVSATLLPGDYPTGMKISDGELKELSIARHDVCPQWNYTLHPRTENCEVVS
jgi:hypothetical protein